MSKVLTLRVSKSLDKESPGIAAWDARSSPSIEDMVMGKSVRFSSWCGFERRMQLAMALLADGCPSVKPGDSMSHPGLRATTAGFLAEGCVGRLYSLSRIFVINMTPQEKAGL